METLTLAVCLFLILAAVRAAVLRDGDEVGGCLASGCGCLAIGLAIVWTTLLLERVFLEGEGGVWAVVEIGLALLAPFGALAWLAWRAEGEGDSDERGRWPPDV